MTKPELEDYAPYHRMAYFLIGYGDYVANNPCRDCGPQGVAQQAYDRGREYAMRLVQWEASQ